MDSGKVDSKVVSPFLLLEVKSDLTECDPSCDLETCRDGVDFNFLDFESPLDGEDEVCDDGGREGLKSNSVDFVGEFDADFFLTFSIDCERGFLLNVTSFTSTMNAMKTIEIPMIDPIIM